jgi:hypothetical protein
MLSGMARRAAKSGPAAGQDELGSSSSNAAREEKDAEQQAGDGETGADSRAAPVAKAPAGRQSSGGPRKSSGAADGERDASETREDKAVTSSANRYVSRAAYTYTFVSVADVMVLYVCASLVKSAVY